MRITAGLLLLLPQLEELAILPVHNPTHRIVHLRDRHFVSKAMYAADLRANSEEPLTDQEIDKAYERLLEEVEQVTNHQRLVGAAAPALATLG